MWPRQPFVGLALAAALGILCADFAPNTAQFALGAIAVLAIIALLLRTSLATYAFVAASFFYLHSLQVIDTPGLRLAAEIGGQPQNYMVHGVVVSEPKFSPNGFASFLFALRTIGSETEQRPSQATIFVRSRAPAEFGDELQLFGTLGPVPPPRNPGEFDMRSYLARRDVRTQLFVSYEGDQTLIRHRGGNVILRAAQKSRRWLQKVLSRGIEDSPDALGLITGMVLGLRHQTPEDIEEPFQQTGHTPSLRRRGIARRNRGAASLDCRHRRATAAKSRHRAHHSGACSFTRRSRGFTFRACALPS